MAGKSNIILKIPNINDEILVKFLYLSGWVNAYTVLIFI